MTVAMQKKLLNELDKVLKRYSGEDYNPEVVIEVLSRSLKRNPKSATEYFKPTDIVITPGKKLRFQRKQMELSLSDLAKKTGIPKSNLSAMENESRPIGLKVAKILAESLGINYKSLL